MYLHVESRLFTVEPGSDMNFEPMKKVFTLFLSASLLYLVFCSDKEAEFEESVQTVSKPCTCQIKPAFVSDQSNIHLLEPYYYNVYQGPMGQEFVPRLHALDAVELQFGDATCSNLGSVGGYVQVRIRERSLRGKILGTSADNHFVNCFSGTVRFDFPRYISVVPGKKYVIEPVYVSGNHCLMYVDNGPAAYTGGDFIMNGMIDTEKDLWFREGLYYSVAIKTDQLSIQGWEKLVRHDGTPFKNQKECVEYIDKWQNMLEKGGG